MQQEAVANFQRRFLDVLVRAMSWVAGLKRDDLFPSALAEGGASIARLEPVLHEGAAGYFLEQRHRSAETPRRRRGHVLRSRMRILGGAEHGGGFLGPIDLIDFR